MMASDCGLLFTISVRDGAEDLLWRVPGSCIKLLEKGWWLESSFLSFAGCEWMLLFEKNSKSSDNDPLELCLCRFTEQPSASPLVRYWLGAVKGDGGREEEEIGRGRRVPGDSVVVSHPWLPFRELRRWMRCSAPPSDPLSFILRLRTGPETDDELRSLVERQEPTPSLEATAEKNRQTDFKEAQTNFPDDGVGGVTNSVTREEISRNDSSTQTDIEWPLNSHLPPATLPDEERREAFRDVTCELESLSSDFSSLLNLQHFADLKLNCGKRSFSVHRSILAARSEVFASMLEVQSIKNESPIVDISDVDDDILELLLKFVYSGKIMDLNDESAPRLCAAGRLYAVHGIQKACTEWMIRNLSPDNCVTFLTVSEESDDDAFKNAVLLFIVNHAEVMKTENWKKFSKVHLKLANEVYENLFSRVFDKNDLVD